MNISLKGNVEYFNLLRKINDYSVSKHRGKRPGKMLHVGVINLPLKSERISRFFHISTAPSGPTPAQF
jgi:hypothetical protein